MGKTHRRVCASFKVKTQRSAAQRRAEEGRQDTEASRNIFPKVVKQNQATQKPKHPAWAGNGTDSSLHCHPLQKRRVTFQEL